MASRLDYYYRQRVTELDPGFELLEKADRDRASDIGIYGVVAGALPTQHSPVVTVHGEPRGISQRIVCLRLPGQARPQPYAVVAQLQPSSIWIGHPTDTTTRIILIARGPSSIGHARTPTMGVGRPSCRRI